MKRRKFLSNSIGFALAGQPLLMAIEKHTSLPAAKNTITAQISITNNTHLRILFQQFNTNGQPLSSWGGSPPEGKEMNEFLKITASQGKKTFHCILNTIK